MNVLRLISVQGPLGEKSVEAIVRKEPSLYNSAQNSIGEVAKPVSDYSNARKTMIASQLRPNRVSNEQVLAAMDAVPRELFVPESFKSVAYMDEDIAVAPGRYIMEPMVLGRLLEAAKIKPSDVVLEIGCATGYSTAILARLASTVVAVDEDAALVQRATDRLSELGVDNAAVIVGPMADGLESESPFQVIFINGAVEEIPSKLSDQLAQDGRLLCVKLEDGVHRGHILTKSAGAVAGRNLFEASAAPLPGFQKRRGFCF